ncbi:hypothetical protein H632_c1791p2, partial [Helicosporidium sp. ATCC 50920]
ASTLGDDEAYNLYDRPLFADRADVFRARGARGEEHGGEDEEADTRRFKPDRGFEGVDYGKASDGAVQFEAAAAADPFGIDQFVSDVRGGRRADGVLGEAPRGGSMASASGQGGGDASRGMRFVKGSSK